MDELSLDLKIRKTESGWEATAYFRDGGGGTGARGRSPQQAVLRMALGLIASGHAGQKTQLHRWLGIEDAEVIGLAKEVNKSRELRTEAALDATRTRDSVSISAS